MNRLHIITITALMFFAASILRGQDRLSSHAKIEFEQREYDMGCVSLSADSIARHNFIFTNTGTDSLVIINAATGCGCTRATYPLYPIAPCRSDTIKVEYNPQGQNLGTFRKSITIFCNEPRSYVRIFVRGKVVE